MDQKYDAIIIGAGIIGGCMAFELSKRKLKTLSVDKLPAAGYGSTSNSCAIVRLHYSTPDGVAMAREGYYYWLDWPRYLEVRDPMGMAFYRNTGCMVVKTKTNATFLTNVMASLDALQVSYEKLAPEQMRRYLAKMDIRKYGPPKAYDDPQFGQPTGGNVDGAIWVPESGYVSDPQLSTHNAQVAAEAKGAKFLFNAEVVEILKENGRVAGVALKDGRRFLAPVVVNVAGPHSFVINKMAGVLDDMKITTRALKQEVCHVPPAAGVEWERDGFISRTTTSVATRAPRWATTS